MKILLITTGENNVRTYIQHLSFDSLVLDCLDEVKSISCEITEIIRYYSPDVLITYRCPYIIPKNILDTFCLGAFNIHPSLLPKYAGLNPWEEIFAAHEKQGGVTIHRLTEHVDAGEIIVQEAFEITAEDTIESARKKADMLAAKLVKYLIPLS